MILLRIDEGGNRILYDTSKGDVELMDVNSEMTSSWVSEGESEIGSST